MTEDGLDLRELKWKELMSRIDAYRFYVKLILEVNAFYYATTGAVVLFYLNKENNYMEFFLLLPVVMGTVVGGFMIYATALQRRNQRIIMAIRAELRRKYHVQIYGIPDLKLLHQLLLVFGKIFFVVAGVVSLVPLLRTLRVPFWKISAVILAVAGIAIVIVGWRISEATADKYQGRRGSRMGLAQYLRSRRIF
ncbi:MAG TPA: hypothetical protein VNG71_00440 [Pyrinomonadaceae bacterium]|nr:hypothetical protein [Pyrinomonadaceae bacterium]